jgi:thiamine transport system ATP-binding protein
MTDPQRGLLVDSVTFRRGGTAILQSVSLQISPGEIVALTGRSGSGKSTLLQVIAGLLAPDTGRVMWDGNDLTAVPPHQRGIGMVFQDRLLFPHLNVAGNIEYGIRHGLKRLPATERAERVEALLNLAGLPGFQRRTVQSLSGGEAQRVALLRALATRPRLLLLDEPLGALDETTRIQLTGDLRQLLQAESMTALHVTHDSDEAAQIADRVVSMNELSPN